MNKIINHLCTSHNAFWLEVKIRVLLLSSLCRWYLSEWSINFKWISLLVILFERFDQKFSKRVGDFQTESLSLPNPFKKNKNKKTKKQKTPPRVIPTAKFSQGMTQMIKTQPTFQHLAKRSYLSVKLKLNKLSENRCVTLPLCLKPHILFLFHSAN